MRSLEASLRMMYGLLADGVLVLHAFFVLFAVFGALLVLRWRWLAVMHVPAVLWAAWVELAGWGCPLTPLELRLRRLAGEQGYAGGFLQHYLFELLYPQGLTRTTQLVLAALLVLINLGLYGLLLQRRRDQMKAR